MLLWELGSEPFQTLLCLVVACRSGLAIPERRLLWIATQSAHTALGEEDRVVGFGDAGSGGSTAAGGRALIGRSRGHDVASAQQIIAAFDECGNRLGWKRQGSRLFCGRRMGGGLFYWGVDSTRPRTGQRRRWGACWRFDVCVFQGCADRAGRRSSWCTLGGARRV